MEISQQSLLKSIVTSFSDFSLKFYDHHNLCEIKAIQNAHKDRISAIQSLNNLSITSSYDGHLNLWDLRTHHTTPSASWSVNEQLTSLSVNSNQSIVSCGSTVNNHQSSLYLW